MMFHCSDALQHAQGALAEQRSRQGGPPCRVKHLAHPRLTSLPLHLDASQPWLHPGIGGVRSAHVGRLLTLAGKVVRAGPTQTLEARRTYECARCQRRYPPTSHLCQAAVAAQERGFSVIVCLLDLQ